MDSITTTVMSNDDLSTIFSVIANLAMIALLYLAGFYWVYIHRLTKRMRFEHRLIERGAKLHQLPAQVHHSVLRDIVDRQRPDQPAERVLQLRFHPLFLKMNHLKEMGTVAGMLFTVLAIILFGFNGTSDIDGMMAIFTTALSTTALGALVSMVTSHSLVRLKVMILEAATLIERSDTLQMGRQRKMNPKAGTA